MPRRREQHEHGIFEEQQLSASEIVERHQQRQGGGDEDHDLQEARESVGDEGAVEDDAQLPLPIEDGDAGRDQHADREPGDDRGPPSHRST